MNHKAPKHQDLSSEFLSETGFFHTNDFFVSHQKRFWLHESIRKIMRRIIKRSANLCEGNLLSGQHLLMRQLWAYSFKDKILFFFINVLWKLDLFWSWRIGQRSKVTWQLESPLTLTIHTTLVRIIVISYKTFWKCHCDIF